MQAMPFLKLVGGVMAAKTAIDGLREGNLGKAILGGVGAYFSFAGAAAGAAGTATSQAAQQGAAAVVQPGAAGGVGGAVGSQAGAEISAAMGTSAANTPTAFGAQTGLLGQAAAGPMSMATEPVLSPAMEAMSSGSLGGLLSGSTAGPMSAAATPILSPAMEAIGQGTLSGAAGNIPSPPPGGWSLGAVKQWAEANPELAANLMQVGGQAIAGYADATARARELQRILNERARERSSRGAVAPVNYDLR